MCERKVIQRVRPRPGGKSLCELGGDVVRNVTVLHCRDESITRHHDRVQRTSRLNGCGTSVTCQHAKLAGWFARTQGIDDTLASISGAHADVSATFLNDVQRVRHIALLHQDCTIVKVSYVGGSGHSFQVRLRKVRKQRRAPKASNIHFRRRRLGD
jgi:hypothetical protein